MASILDILDGLRTAIEAVTPTEPANQDDVFRTFTPTSQITRGSRATLVSASAPVPIKPGMTCADYRTTITLTTGYAIGAPEAGQRSTYERALLDSESIAAAILAWAGTADDVLQHEQSEGEINDDGNGMLMVERSLTVQYSRGA